MTPTSQAPQRVGIYSTARQVVSNPDYLRVLRDTIGLNVVLLWFSGDLPHSVRAHSPWGVEPPDAEQIRSTLASDFDGRPSTERLDEALGFVGPHVPGKGDDAQLRKAIAIAREIGIDVWMLQGLYSFDDFQCGLFSPHSVAVNDWFAHLLPHLAIDYDVQGIAITHARYTMTSQPRGYLMDAGPAANAAAAVQGYDMTAMIAGLRSSWRRLQDLEIESIQTLTDASALDLIQLLDPRGDVHDWFRFRSQTMHENLVRFRADVASATQGRATFVVDSYPPTLAPLVGQDLSRWQEVSDVYTPLLAHLDIFPMNTIVLWTQTLVRLFPAIEEPAAVAMATRLAGYGSLPMPASIAGFAIGAPDGEFRNVPLREVIRRDLVAARTLGPASQPSMPIIQGGGEPWLWPRDSIDGIRADIRELGHEGYLLQGASQLVDYELRD